MGLGQGLPPASVYDIQINPATNKTVIFTYGRGAFELVPSGDVGAQLREPGSSDRSVTRATQSPIRRLALSTLPSHASEGAFAI